MQFNRINPEISTLALSSISLSTVALVDCHEITRYFSLHFCLQDAMYFAFAYTCLAHTFACCARAQGILRGGGGGGSKAHFLGGSILCFGHRRCL